MHFYVEASGVESIAMVKRHCSVNGDDGDDDDDDDDDDDNDDDGDGDGEI
jgi:hypothetical protein